MNFDQKSLFIIFFIFSEKAGVVDYFAAAFNVPNVHQIWQILDENDPLHFFYNPMWSDWAKWQYISTGDSLKRPTQSAFVCRFYFFSEKTGLVDYFAAAFNVPNVHRI